MACRSGAPGSSASDPTRASSDAPAPTSVDTSNPPAPEVAPLLTFSEPGRGDRVVIATTATRTLAFIANEDDGAVHTVDVAQGAELSVTQLSGHPSALVGLASGSLAVALRDRNEVVLLSTGEDPTAPLELSLRAPVASEPVGLAADAGGRLWVTSSLGRALTVLDSTLSQIRKLELSRDPRAVVAYGDKIYVSHVSSSALSVIDAADFSVSSLDVLSGQKAFGETRGTFTEREANGQLFAGGQVFALASDGASRLFVPMVTVDPGEPKITGAYGSTEVPIKPYVGVVDLIGNRALQVRVPSMFSMAPRACTLPRAAAVRGNRLFVACAGVDELLELDARVDNAVSAIRRRTRVASGPLGLALTAESAVVVSQFDREVDLVPLGGGEVVRVALSRPADSEVDSELERGRKIFHDSFDVRVSRDGRACASCHPDGRDDGNTWSSPDGPRQTLTLAGRVAGSQPFGWFGEHPTLASHLSLTVRRLGGSGFVTTEDEADLTALIHYLEALPAPVPTEPDATEREHLEHGRALFAGAEQGCASCHMGGGTDRARHDVKSGNPDEASVAFETPSLELVAASAPYFHDGRYATLEALLDATNGTMGHSKHLSPEDRGDLVRYMRSLTPPRDAVELSLARTFVAGPPPRPLSPDAETTLERAALVNGAPPVFLSLPLELSAIPVVETEPEISWDPKSNASQGGEDLKGEIVQGGCVPGHAAALLRLDWRTVGITRASQRCTPGPDNDGKVFWKPLRLQTVDPNSAGTLHFEDKRGWVNVVDDTKWATRVVAGDAAPIAGGLAFVLRVRCAACAEERERDQLVIITPDGGERAFETRYLSLAAGEVSHVSGAVSWQKDVELWARSTGATLDLGAATAPAGLESIWQPATSGHPRGLQIRVDASRTTSDPEARIAVGVRACIPDQDC
ncbi:MAG: hypothetical protein U0271_40825 [Polyangiaceae bacterium]